VEKSNILQPKGLWTIHRYTNAHSQHSLALSLEYGWKFTNITYEFVNIPTELVHLTPVTPEFTVGHNPEILQSRLLP